MIIDGHVHLHSGKLGGFNASVKSYLRVMEKNKIQKAVLAPIAPWISNEFVCKIVKEYPDRFIGFASVIPTLLDAPNTLQKAVTKFGLKGLKIHPEWQGFRPNDPIIFPLIHKVNELKIPVLIHCDGLRQHTTPQIMMELTNAFPQVNFILAHMGGLLFREALYMACVFKNVYLDTSCTIPDIFRMKPIPQLNLKTFSAMIRGFEGVEKKLIFASDFPFCNCQHAIKYIKSLKTKKEVINMILGQNICRLLDLPFDENI